MDEEIVGEWGYLEGIWERLGIFYWRWIEFYFLVFFCLVMEICSFGVDWRIRECLEEFYVSFLLWRV